MSPAPIDAPPIDAATSTSAGAAAKDERDLRHEAAALLVLTRAGRLSPTRYAELVETRGSALAVLRRERVEASPQTSFFADPERDLQTEVAAAEREIAAWRTQGLHLITVLDPSYPQYLRAAHDRPPMIFVAGRLRPADDRAVAVIGSREATPAGRLAAASVAEHLVGARYTVMSGLAAGIDTAAHAAALRSGGRTVAVIGTGLLRCYPRSNVTLQRRIAAECAVVSQFLPDTPPTRQTFPMRNAVMSGLSLASVIIEASATSGARIQARCALGQGRPVFLLEGVLHNRWAQDLAAVPGVYVVSSPAEITAALGRLTSSEALVA
jgi:DNA processing protein